MNYCYRLNCIHKFNLCGFYNISKYYFQILLGKVEDNFSFDLPITQISTALLTFGKCFHLYPNIVNTLAFHSNG